MGDISVFISGEDAVTIAVIKRLLDFVSPRFSILQTIPARGGEVKRKVLESNTLAKDYPVIMLLDLDQGCAPSLKNSLLQGEPQSKHFLMNISVDEAEAWLMADRIGFASYFGIGVDKIPVPKMQRQGGAVARLEMDFPIMKSSLVLTHQLALLSSKTEIRRKIGVAVPNGPKKGKEYNIMMLLFHTLKTTGTLQRLYKIQIVCKEW